MIYWFAIILGVLQGIAEFLPISSSGHIVLGAEALGTPLLRKVEFNLAVHLGTLGSILVVYRSKLWENRLNVPLWSRVVLATIPIVIFGLLFKDTVEAKLEDPKVVGFFLLLTAAFLTLMTIVERRDDIGELTGRTLETMTWLDALIVGVMQCIAIFPGVSRSGTTIFAGTLAGVRREAAADFSFFIALPAIAGPAVLYTKDIVEQGSLDVPLDVLFTGGMIAFLVGIVALKGLLALVSRGQLWWFAIYCGVLGIGAIIATGALTGGASPAASPA